MVTASTVPEAKLRTMLSESAAFRTWTSTASSALALARIYVGHQATVTRPFAMIGVKDHVRQDTADGNQIVPDAGSGACLLMFEQAAGSGDATAELLGFHATCVNVINDVWALSGVSDHLCVRRTRLLSPPMRSVPEEGDSDGDYLDAVYEVLWRP